MGRAYRCRRVDRMMTAKAASMGPPALPRYNGIPPMGAPRNDAEEIANARAELAAERETQ
tara:strand:+ start:416 stop:595 length:180 start_codon:yes stop_codon:yes gene_type:complete